MFHCASLSRPLTGIPRLQIKILRYFSSKDKSFERLKNVSYTDTIFPTNVITFPQQFEREANVWSRLSHQNIKPFYSICFNMLPEPLPCLVSPFLNNSDVVHYLNAHPNADRTALVSVFYL
jgi:serine/threonine protein kinase